MLGVFGDRLGAIWPGFILLSATALALRFANQRVFHPGDVEWTRALPVAARQALERVKAGAWATLVVAGLAAAIIVGSRNLQHFDAALVGYTFATLFAAFGISYRYAMWLNRPPTRMYWRRGWQAFFSRSTFGHNTHVMVPRTLVTRAAHVDVVSAMDEQPRSRAVSLKVLAEAPASAEARIPENDPFAEVEV